MPEPRTLDDPRLIAETLERLAAAERVLIGAGAGMSVDAGVDYGDREHFARRFPAMLQYGFGSQWETMGFDPPDAALKWGFLAEHVHSVRWETPPHPVYTNLLALLQDKDYFVITSNADGMFETCGFDDQRLFTPQGSYARFQCLTPCTDETWPLKPVIDRILPYVDPETQRITNPRVVPECPNCGGAVFMNVRGGPWFIEEPYEPQYQRYASWLNASKDAKLLIMEVGAGFNTPGVIRWPLENLTRQLPGAHMIRINPDRPEIPAELNSRSTSVASRGYPFIQALFEGRALRA